jgi:nitrate reductase molybdenum cofactor assembly chaperone NarJ/NarW
MSVSPYKLASVLLQYPTIALFDGIGILEAEAAAARRPAEEVGLEPFAPPGYLTGTETTR